MINIAQTAMLMAILTLISKCFGFVREMVMANYFGTSFITDAYVMATAIPNIIFTGVLGAIATAYMPLYSRIYEQEGEFKANSFTNQVINLLLIISIFSALLGLFFSDQIVNIFASGFSGETATLTSFFVKITFSYVIFTSTASLLESFLQYNNVFLPQIIIGYVQNAVVIIVIIISAIFNYYFLAFGWLFAYLLRLLIITFISRKKSYIYSLELDFGNTTKKILALSIPVFLGSSVSQIGSFVDKTLASNLSEGSVSALNYGNLIVSMIVGITISIVTTLTYPKLNQARSQDNQHKFNEIVSTGIAIIEIIAIPCTLGILIYNKEIVQLIYERGSFDSYATLLTSSAFLYYSLGLAFGSVNSLLTQIYYTNHDTKMPVILASISVIIDIVLNLILVKSMGHNGLALATSIAVTSNSLMLYMVAKRKYPEVIMIKSKMKFFYITISAIIAIGVSNLIYITVNNVLIIPMILQLFLIVILAGIVYLILLIIFKVEEVKLLKYILWRK